MGRYNGLIQREGQRSGVTYIFVSRYSFINKYSSIEQHYDDVIMTAIASQITSLTIVYPVVYSDADQRKHLSSASLAFMRGIHRGPVNSPHKWPVTRKMFPLDDVIMRYKLIHPHKLCYANIYHCPAKPHMKLANGCTNKSHRKQCHNISENLSVKCDPGRENYYDKYHACIYYLQNYYV